MNFKEKVMSFFSYFSPTAHHKHLASESRGPLPSETLHYLGARGGYDGREQNPRRETLGP